MGPGVVGGHIFGEPHQPIARPERHQRAEGQQSQRLKLNLAGNKQPQPILTAGRYEQPQPAELHKSSDPV